MEISLIADPVTTLATNHGLGFAKFTNSASDQPSSAGTVQISALIFPIDAVAPPPVKSNYFKTAPKGLVRKRRRTKRRSTTDGGADDGEDGGFYGGDGSFGGGSGGGGGNFDGFGGGFNWDESSSASPADPAFDFIYSVLCWIVFSNCLHFAFKKVVRIVTDGISDADPGRQKVPVC